MTATRYDIEQHVINPTIGSEYDQDTISAITDAILEAAPLSTWNLVEPTGYESTAIDTDEFWAIIERVAASGE